MASQQSLLDKPKKSTSKIFWVILSVAAILSSSALIASYFTKPNYASYYNICDHALDTASCLAHVSEVAQGPILTATKDHKLNLLHSFLMKSTPHIKKAMDSANAIRNRINSPKEEAGLRDCEELMELSINRVWDSMMALTKNTIESKQDAHTWLSSVLTNHATCLDGLEGTARTLMEAEVENLKSRARTSLAVLVAALAKVEVKDFIEEALNGEFPSWVKRSDRRLLMSKAGEIKADVVVAKDGSGKYKTLGEAVAAAPEIKDDRRYVIYVKKGKYIENVEIGSKKRNVMLVGDGMDLTIISGSKNNVDDHSTFKSATVAAVGDGFIAQDIRFENTAGPKKDQAVALRVGSDKSVINRCHINAFQDTLYPHSNRQFYRDTFITGTVDFIFGNAAVVFQKCKIVARKPLSNQKNMVTAQGREDQNQNTGTSIQQCDVIPSTDLKPVLGSIKTYLGRPWKDYSRTCVMQSLISYHIDPAGWSEWDSDTKYRSETVYYAEYSNNGPGAGTSGRVNWPGYHVLTSKEEAYQFTVKQLIQGDQWLKNTGVNYIEGL